MIKGLKSNRIFKNGRFQPGILYYNSREIVEKGDSYIDVGNAFVIPRLIDLQVNGGFDIDLAREPHRVEELARKLYATGIGAFCPTLISLPLADYKHILPHFKPRKVKEGATILGAHLEGPHLAISGAHDPKNLSTLEKLPLENVKIVTLAPELVSAPYITKLKKRGIVVSAGHSNASYSLLKKLKIEFVTHIFNAMGPFHHRTPGLIDYALTEPVYYSLIADGKHVSKTAMEIAKKANPEGLILVSDLNPSFGSRKKTFTLGSKTYKKGDLAGSETALLEMAVSLQDIAAVTERPADLLNIKPLGTLEPGAPSNFLVL